MTAMTTDPLPGLPDPAIRPDFYAGVPAKRALAWVVDSAIILIATALISLVTVVGLFFLPFMFLLIGFLYRWVTIASSSATPGMRLFAIEFRDRDGRRFDPALALLHTAGYSISVAVFPVQFVSIALMLISERGQGLTDHLLGTTALARAA